MLPGISDPNSKIKTPNENFPGITLPRLVSFIKKPTKLVTRQQINRCNYLTEKKIDESVRQHDSLDERNIFTQLENIRNNE